jgi:hypothetical protein
MENLWGFLGLKKPCNKIHEFCSPGGCMEKPECRYPLKLIAGKTAKVIYRLEVICNTGQDPLYVYEYTLSKACGNHVHVVRKYRGHTNPQEEAITNLGVQEAVIYRNDLGEWRIQTQNALNRVSQDRYVFGRKPKYISFSVDEFLGTQPPTTHLKTKPAYMSEYSWFELWHSVNDLNSLFLQ